MGIADFTTEQKRQMIAMYGRRTGHIPTPAQIQRGDFKTVAGVQGSSVATRARENLEAYVKYSFLHPGGFNVADHHRLMFDAFEAVAAHQCDRLMVFMPPRHSKSEVMTVRGPAWYMGNNPDNFIITCSHSTTRARTFGRQVRDQVSSIRWPFQGVELSGSTHAANEWELAAPHRGRYIGATVRQGIAGEGAHLLLIDDPIRHRAEAESATYRQQLWEWYINDAITRLMPRGAIVLTLTRYHDDDLAGRLIKAWRNGGDRWEVLELPALAYEPDDPYPYADLDGMPDEYIDPLGREPGQALWPEWWSKEYLEARRDATGDDMDPEETGKRAFASLYQQRPILAGNRQIKLDWFGASWQKLEDLEINRIMQFVDSSFTDGVSSDWSVCATWAAVQYQKREWFALLDVWRDRVEYPDLLSALRAANNKWSGIAGHRVPLYIENKASGISAIQSLRRELRVPAIAWPPDDAVYKKVGQSGKESRVDAITPLMESGKVLLPESARWLRAWLDEHLDFGALAHDDQVDTTSMALLTLPTVGRGRVRIM